MRARLIVVGLVVVGGWLPVAPTEAVGVGPVVSTVAGDFDGDRRSDLAMWQPADGSWAYRSRGDSGDPSWSFGHGLHGSAADIVAVARDYDGDHLTDSALYRRSTGSWSILESSSTVPRARELEFGDAGDIAVPADYDGDGRADPAVYRQSDGTWRLLRSRDGFHEVSFGTATDRPVPGDYDGDGYSDLAVFRPSTGVWIVLRSSDQVVTHQTWGAPDDKLVPADYDGDGVTDVAIFRPSTGQWWIRKSSDKTADVVEWGSETDQPVPADYDGNGSADPAVYRSATDGAGGDDGGRWMIADAKADVLFGRPGQLPMPAS